MYGLSDQWNDMFRTRVSAVRHGSSRYSGRMPQYRTSVLVLPPYTGLPVTEEPMR